MQKTSDKALYKKILPPLSKNKPEAKTITVLSKSIKLTAAYKRLDPIRQKIVLRGANVKVLQHGVNVSTYNCFFVWRTQTQTTLLNKEIVQDLLTDFKIVDYKLMPK